MAVGAAALWYPERTASLLQDAFSVLPEDARAGDAGTGSLLLRIDLKGFVADNPPSHWLVFVSAVFVGLLAGRISSAALGRIGRRLEAQGWTARSHWANDLIGPASLALFTVGFAVGLAVLNMSDPLREFCSKTVLLLYSIAVFWYAYNLIAVVDIGLRRISAKTESKLDLLLAR